MVSDGDATPVEEQSSPGQSQPTWDFSQLHGFQFVGAREDAAADADVADADRRRALALELDQRANRFHQAVDASIVLASDGAIRWLGDPVAKLTGGSDLLQPRTVLLVDEAMSEEAQRLVATRIELWVSATVHRLLGPLFALREVQEGPKPVQELAAKVAGALGVLDREPVRGLVRGLDQTARAILRRHGIRFGSYYLYVPTALKPASRALALQLWCLQKGDEELSAAAQGLIPMATSGRTSAAPDARVSPQMYRVAGFRLCGDRVVRVDIVERLADMIRAASTLRIVGAPDKGSPAFLVSGQMTSLTGCSGESFGSILTALGFESVTIPRSQIIWPATAAPAVQTPTPAADAAEPASDALDDSEPTPGEAEAEGPTPSASEFHSDAEEAMEAAGDGLPTADTTEEGDAGAPADASPPRIDSTPFEASSVAVDSDTVPSSPTEAADVADSPPDAPSEGGSSEGEAAPLPPDESLPGLDSTPSEAFSAGVNAGPVASAPADVADSAPEASPEGVEGEGNVPSPQLGALADHPETTVPPSDSIDETAGQAEEAPNVESGPPDQAETPVFEPPPEPAEHKPAGVGEDEPITVWRFVRTVAPARPKFTRHPRRKPGGPPAEASARVAQTEAPANDSGPDGSGRKGGPGGRFDKRRHEDRRKPWEGAKGRRGPDDRREDAPAASGRPPREKKPVVDPMSPFAKLMELRSILESESKKRT